MHGDCTMQKRWKAEQKKVAYKGSKRRSSKKKETHFPVENKLLFIPSKVSDHNILQTLHIIIIINNYIKYILVPNTMLDLISNFNFNVNSVFFQCFFPNLFRNTLSTEDISRATDVIKCEDHQKFLHIILCS